MKKGISFLLLIFLLSSCFTENQVSSSFSKNRQYARGWRYSRSNDSNKETLVINQLNEEKVSKDVEPSKNLEEQIIIKEINNSEPESIESETIAHFSNEIPSIFTRKFIPQELKTQDNSTADKINKVGYGPQKKTIDKLGIFSLIFMVFGLTLLLSMISVDFALIGYIGIALIILALTLAIVSITKHRKKYKAEKTSKRLPIWAILTISIPLGLIALFGIIIGFWYAMGSPL